MAVCEGVAIVRMPYDWCPGWAGPNVHLSRLSTCRVVANLFAEFFGDARAAIDTVFVLVEGRTRHCPALRELI